MGHHSYEEAKKFAYFGLKLLAVVTIIEVIISLFGKGYLGWEEAYYLTWVHYVCGAVIIVLSLYKAYFIVFNFMHLGSESRSMIRTVLLPLLLLIFAIIAFIWEGAYWHNNRSYILQQDLLESEMVVPEIPASIEVESMKGIQ